MGPSTYESVGASDVNSRSKFAVSSASTCALKGKDSVTETKGVKKRTGKLQIKAFFFKGEKTEG
jgi:hypothetical protein